MNFNKINIGEEIKRVTNEKRLSNASFAKKLNIQRQNIERTVFAKASLDTELLIRISEVLDYNFLALYFECNHINYITPLECKAVLTIEMGEEKSSKKMTFRFGENNIEILNK